MTKGSIEKNTSREQNNIIGEATEKVTVTLTGGGVERTSSDSRSMFTTCVDEYGARQLGEEGCKTLYRQLRIDHPNDLMI